MILKPGVNMSGVQPEILRAMADIHATMEATGEFTLTACLDGKHKATSLHYKGLAVDIRSKHMGTMLKLKTLNDLRSILGPDFDVLLEGEGTENEHYHLEWDPKDRPLKITPTVNND